MPVIEVTNLRKRYRDRVAVDDVSFTVEQGEVFGILGPRGAGKTTVVECIEGLSLPDSGTVSVLGLDPWRDAAKLRTRVIGAILHESRLPGKIKVWEALSLYASFYRGGSRGFASPEGHSSWVAPPAGSTRETPPAGRTWEVALPVGSSRGDRRGVAPEGHGREPADYEQLIEDMGLWERRNSTYEELSADQKQRLSIALALVGNPDIAILDELTTGLEPQARRDTRVLIQKIRERGVTIVFVTRLVEDAERLCDRVAVIDSGRLMAIDTPSGLVARVNPERIRFRPSVPLDDRLLKDLPEVHAVIRIDSYVVVTGTGNFLQAVTSVLARNRIIAADLRVERSDLGDAYAALTGRFPDTG